MAEPCRGSLLSCQGKSGASSFSAAVPASRNSGSPARQSFSGFCGAFDPLWDFDAALHLFLLLTNGWVGINTFGKEV